MSTNPNDDECETLAAMQRITDGSWELLKETDILACLERKWLEFSPPNHYRLTAAGRDVLDRCQRRKK